MNLSSSFLSSIHMYTWHGQPGAVRRVEMVAILVWKKIDVKLKNLLYEIDAKALDQMNGGNK